VRIGEFRGLVRVPRRALQCPLPESAIPGWASKARCLQQTEFESPAREEAPHAPVNWSGSPEITGRDLR
jgi:hypothetical protein